MSGRIEMHALHVLRRVETRDFAGSVKPPNHSSSVCWLHVYRKLNLLFSSENSTHEQTKRENTASGTLMYLKLVDVSKWHRWGFITWPNSKYVLEGEV